MDNSAEESPACKRQRLTAPPIDVNNLESSAPDEDSPQHILNRLNNHCIQEIFKRISIVDLNSVTDVCTRFKQNAEEIFSLYHQKRFRCVSLTLVKPQIFRNFAHLIKSVYLNGSGTNDCLDSFNPNNNVIESLRLRSADISVNKLEPLLPKLKSLELSNCAFNGEHLDLFSFCVELQHLKVKLSQFDKFASCKMPKLKKFEFDDHFHRENLKSFIEMNPQLSSISIGTTDKVRGPKNFQEHLMQIGELKSLCALKLPCYHNSVGPLMNLLRTNNTPIQQLELENGRIDDESLEDIFQLKSMKILTIWNGTEKLSNEQFIGLSRELPHLEVVRLETQSEHNLSVTFDEIQSFVENSKKLYLLTVGTVDKMTIDETSYNSLLKSLQTNPRKTLTISIVYLKSVDILVPKQILKSHKETIRILKIKYDNYNYFEDADDESDESTSSDDGSDIGSDDGSDSSDTSDFASLFGSDDESDNNFDDDSMDDVYISIP